MTGGPVGARGPGDAIVPPRSWYDRPVLAVARDLVGAWITHRTVEGEVTLRISEVEAYDGAGDPGSHAFRGPTPRTRAMFGDPGRLYVYRHLGLHHCVNVVCGPRGTASGVLIRGGGVVEGVEIARNRRLAGGVVRTDRDIARGPARLAVALGIDLGLYGADLTDPDGEVVLRRDPGAPVGPISTGPRVGVAGEGGRADRYPWRLWTDGDPTVSPYRPASRRVRRP